MQANNVKGSSTVAQSNCPGAYIKFRVTLATTGDVTLNLDNAHLATVAVGDFPQVIVSRDALTPVVTQLSGTATQALPVAAALGPGTYNFTVLFKSAGLSVADRWSVPRLSVKVDSLTIPADAVLAAPRLRNKRALIYGDSLTEGVHNIGATLAPADQDAGYTWAHFIAAAMDAEVGIVGFGGQSFVSGGVGSVPSFPNAWGDYSFGRPRLVGGLLSPMPDRLVVAHGENDTTGGALPATITSTLAAIRAAAGACPISLMVPFTGKVRSDIGAATLPSNTRIIDVQLNGGDGSHLLFYPGFQNPLHPSIAGSAYLAPRISKLIEHGDLKTPRSITIVLTADGSIPRANLSSLKWVWFDQPIPGSLLSPTAQGVVESTDASGVLLISFATTLASGAVGWLTITDSDGTTTQNPAHQAFSGPVQVN